MNNALSIAKGGKIVSVGSDRESSRTTHSVQRGLAATMPVLLVGSLAMTAWNVAAPTHGVRTHSAHTSRRPGTTITGSATPIQTTAEITESTQIASVVPATYTVVTGDTISGIAGRFGLSTASVLTLNGLSWTSLIFPRQVLRLSAAAKPAGTAPAAGSGSSADQSTPVLASSVTRKYTIARGDTVTSIARKFGVTVQAILAANHLVASSIIYAGRTLVIPTSTAPASVGSIRIQPAQVGTTTDVLSPSMAANAGIIIGVGKARGVPQYGLVIALAAAMQESGLENLSYGDRDSVGLFQQRPSVGWGSVTQLENPTYAAELFFGGPLNPNKGRTRGLLDIPGWQSMTVTQAAQAVQISATPNAYAKWEADARAWVAQLG